MQRTFIFPVYGGKCLSRKAVHKWVEKFSQRRSNIAENARTSRLVETATEATVQRAEELIRSDRRVTIDSVATALGCSRGLAYSIMHDRLKFRKVRARWVPLRIEGSRRNEQNGSVLATSLTVCR
jgi:transposase